MINMFIDLECLPGYFGTNCSSRGAYPRYGQTCQNTCYCNVTDCNHVHGCQGDRSEKESTTGWYFIKSFVQKMSNNSKQH